jgi:hypothetical protein
MRGVINDPQMTVVGCEQSFVRSTKMSAVSIKQPFQSGYLMDISRCIERLEIAQKRQSEYGL